MRIITGKYKNRVIKTNCQADYRPSTSRLRESLFSILTSHNFDEILNGAEILDLYCGTGILSFEALSRGANSSTLIDINSKYLASAKEFAEKIGASNSIETICANALEIRRLDKKYDIVFLDPPYAKGLSEKTINMLAGSNILKNGSIICIETSKREKTLEHKSMELLTDRIIGNSRLTIFRLINCP